MYYLVFIILVGLILTYLFREPIKLTLLGANYIVKVLNKRAMKEEDRVGKFWLGPSILNPPCMVIANGPDTKTLQYITSAHDPELRKTFQPFVRIFGLQDNPLSVNFIAHSNKTASDNRQKVKQFLTGKTAFENIHNVSLKMISDELDAWTTEQSVTDVISHIVFKIFGKTVLGYENIPLDIAHMYEEVEQSVIFDSPPLFGKIPITPWQYRFHKTTKKYIEYMKNIISMNKDSIMDKSKPNYTYVLMEEMAQKYGGTPEQYIDHEYVRVAPSLYLAMGNLIAIMAFSLFILRDNTEDRDKIFQEMQRITSWEDFENAEMMKHTNKVINELLRYVSPANLMSRYTSKDIQLGNKNIPKGSYLMICIKSIMHDPKVWKNPEVFDPKREIPTGFKYPFIPFSIGERMCPGMQSANLVFKTFLYVLKDYDFVPSFNNPPFSIPMDDPVIRLDKCYKASFIKNESY